MMPILNPIVLAAGNSLAASILAKVTIAAALGLTGARLARKSRAAVRHALLAAAFGAVLVLPVASIVAPTVRIAMPVAAHEAVAQGPPVEGFDAMAAVEPGDRSPAMARTTPQDSRLSLATLLTMGWLAGAMLCLLPMALGLWQVRGLRRSGMPWMEGQPLVDRLAREAGIGRRVELLLHEALPGPATCGVARPAIMLPAEAQTWDVGDLQRAMVHELEHVRRWDWVSQSMARIVCAVYWFHPLVWLAGRQLALEAERSCDDAVLGRSEATAYADQLVGLAKRLLLAAKSPALAMANRADLATRVGAVLDHRQVRGRAGARIVVLACAAATLAVLAMSPLRMIAAPQAPSSQTPAIPQFEAVSVKLIDPDIHGEHSSEHTDAGRLRMTGTMHRFIIRAYGITDGQLGGEPSWFKSRLYSIEGVTSGPKTGNQMMLMLRGVLADRFQLKIREEEKELPAYGLEVAPGGPKFKALKPGEVVQKDPEQPGTFARVFRSVEELMNSLNGVFGGRLAVDRPVVDRTHLTGDYQMLFKTDIETKTDDFGGRSIQFPNLAHDLQSELGLRLVPEKIKMSYFAVESAAAPTAN